MKTKKKKSWQPEFAPLKEIESPHAHTHILDVQKSNLIIDFFFYFWSLVNCIVKKIPIQFTTIFGENFLSNLIDYCPIFKSMFSITIQNQYFFFFFSFFNFLFSILEFTIVSVVHLSFSNFFSLKKTIMNGSSILLFYCLLSFMLIIMIDPVPIRQTYDENKNPMEKFSPFDDNNDGGSSSSSNKDVDDESIGGRIKNCKHRNIFLIQFF